MYVKDKRYNDALDPDDGLRVLVCRLRPRGLAKARETWHSWEKTLAPSLPLLRAFQGKTDEALGWESYRQRFLREMESTQSQEALDRLAQVVAKGRPVTLLCASACHDRSRCHRSLLVGLLEEKLSISANR